MDNKDLAKRDYVLMIDKSASMNTEDCPGGKSRWAYAQEQTQGLAVECAKFDDDGISIVVFNTHHKNWDNITGGPGQVERIFTEESPSGSTDTAAALKFVLDDYFTRKAANPGATKPLTIMCVTDGRPDDEYTLEQCIIDATGKIASDDELGISFLQIGKDEHARTYLKSLDDNLVKKGAKFDVVDTESMDEMADLSLVDLLIKAVTD